MKAQGRLGIWPPALRPGAFEIGAEDEAVAIDALQQHHADIWPSRRIAGAAMASGSLGSSFGFGEPFLWDRLDFLVHAIAFSDREQLKGRYLDTTAENFAMTMNISCYSFTAVVQRAERLMTNGGTLLTLTYYGAEKVMPHYNVMGVAKAALEASVRYLAEDLGKKNIRVNALSAGPIRTLAAAGIGDFRYILKWNELNSPLRRTVSTRVGDCHISGLRSRTRDHRRGDACRLWVSRCRDESGRRPRHFRCEERRRLAAALNCRGLMSFNTFGHLFRVTTFGESHGPASAALLTDVRREFH